MQLCSQAIWTSYFIHSILIYPDKIIKVIDMCKSMQRKYLHILVKFWMVFKNIMFKLFVSNVIFKCSFQLKHVYVQAFIYIEIIWRCLLIRPTPSQVQYCIMVLWYLCFTKLYYLSIFGMTFKCFHNIRAFKWIKND